MERTKTRAQTTFEFNLNKQMKTLPFLPLMNQAEEGKWLLAVTSVEATNSVFKITDENNSFLISTLGQWSPEGGGENINKMDELLQLRSQSDIELHVKEVTKRSTRKEIETSGCDLAGFDHLKCEILEELRRVKDKHLEGMVS